MEEAEALSTKMGIMVTGGVFKAFGTSQEIKDRHGTGYEIEFKVYKLNVKRRKDIIAEYRLDNYIDSYNSNLTLDNIRKIISEEVDDLEVKQKIHKSQLLSK
jgi:ABC-type multidrug transport system ATPase subunit